METIERNHKLCLEQQTELRRLMASRDQFKEALQLFFVQHAMLHSSGMSGMRLWSFEDALLDDLDEARFRWVPPGCAHSIAWLVWHMARCEDITLNLLVAGGPQVLLNDDWLEKLGVAVCDSGNAMSPGQVADFSARVDLGALRAYRAAVGRATRRVVQRLGPDDLKKKVAPARMQQLWEQGAVLEPARGIADYWSKRDVAGLLLMPATRHNLVHLNEALDLKRRRR